MNKLKVAICDDDTLLIKVISSTIRTTLLHMNINSEIFLFQKPSQLLSSIKLQKYDLLFLDIGLPETDGISLGKKLRDLGYDTPIIYLSAMDDKVYDCFEINPFSFIRKSVFVEEIERVLKRFINSYSNYNLQKLVIKESNNRTVCLEIPNILFVESEIKNQKIFIFGKPEPLRLKCTMNYLEDALKHNGFLRSQRAYLVNCKYIQYIEYDKIYLTTGHIVPLGRTKSEEFLEQYINLMA